MAIIHTGSRRTASIGKIWEPDDPWSYIGYWGDHQIIYLLKFLEFFEKTTIQGSFKAYLTKTYLYMLMFRTGSKAIERYS